MWRTYSFLMLPICLHVIPEECSKPQDNCIPPEQDINEDKEKITIEEENRKCDVAGTLPLPPKYLHGIVNGLPV